MRRLHLFEIEDQSWCPRWLRDAMTDFLAAAIRRTDLYAPAADVLEPVLRRCGATEIVDLASGGGGPWPLLLPRLRRRGLDLRVQLTDLHPNASAAARLGHNGVTYVSEPVSALAVPASLRGFRTLFSSLHHFRPHEARALLRDACDAGVGVAAFEGTRRTPATVLAALAVPFLTLWVTPSARPRTLGRFAFTYVIPVIPLTAWWDGTISCLRSYTVDELRGLADGLGGDDYRWDAGEIRPPGAPLTMTYLVGEPLRRGRAVA